MAGSTQEFPGQAEAGQSMKVVWTLSEAVRDVKTVIVWELKQAVVERNGTVAAKLEAEWLPLAKTGNK